MNTVFGMLKAVPVKGWIAIAILSAVSATAVMGWNKYNGVLDAYEEALLTIDRYEAEADSTRKVLDSYQDSLVVYQRRSVQMQMRLDTLDMLLGVQTAANASLRLRVDSLVARVSSSVTEAGDTLKMDFSKDTSNYSVNVHITVPPPDSLNVRPLAWADINVRIKPIPVDIRLSCNPNQNETLNQATINITTRSSINVEVESVSQDPNICNPDLRQFDNRSWYEKPGWVAGITATVVTIILRVF